MATAMSMSIITEPALRAERSARSGSDAPASAAAMHRLWQLVSPSLPVGAFQYSQGLENAIDRKVVRDDATARDWIAGVFDHVICWVDLPLLRRVHVAWSRRDSDRVRHWNALAVACRETRELRDEDTAMGRALSELAGALGEPYPILDLGYVAGFAVMAANAGIDADTAAHAYAWAWCENQALIAIRAVPLGHLQGQAMLRSLADAAVGGVEASAAVADDAIGRTLPGFALASMFHETQYSRNFRS